MLGHSKALSFYRTEFDKFFGSDIYGKLYQIGKSHKIHKQVSLFYYYHLYSELTENTARISL